MRKQKERNCYVFITFFTCVLTIKLIMKMISILLEKYDKLIKIASSLPAKLKDTIEIQPNSGSIQPQKEEIVKVQSFYYTI